MRRTFVAVLALFLGAVLVLGLASQAYAQEKAPAKEKKAAAVKESRVSGTVQMINKDTSTITVRDRNNVMRQVVYTPDTKFTKVNKPGGSLDEIKEGTRVICLGKFDEKTRLVASRIDIRLPR